MLKKIIVQEWNFSIVIPKFETESLQGDNFTSINPELLQSLVMLLYSVSCKLNHF